MGAAAVLARNRGFSLMESGLGLWIGLNLLITFAVPNISIGGHIGGLIGGGLVALAVQFADRVRQPLLAYAGAIAVAGASVAIGLAVAGGSGL